MTVFNTTRAGWFFHALHPTDQVTNGEGLDEKRCGTIAAWHDGQPQMFEVFHMKKWWLITGFIILVIVGLWVWSAVFRSRAFPVLLHWLSVLTQ